MRRKADPNTVRVIARLDRLIADAKNLRVSSDNAGRIWFIRASRLLSDFLAPNDPFRRAVEQESIRGSPIVIFVHVRNAAEILQALRDDIASGNFGSVATIAYEQVTSELLDQADYLFEAGFHIPAATLTGAALEEGLRQIAVVHHLQWEGRSSIASLNHLLSDASVYSSIVEKQIELWNTVRNKADHGELDQFGKEDVRGMLKGVRGFLSKMIASPV